MRKVAVTGIGLVTPLGNDVSSTWDKIKKGEHGFDFVEFNGKFPFKVIAGKVKDFIPDEYVKNNDKFIQFAFRSSLEAIKDSYLDISSMDKNRIGCVISSSKGGMETFSKVSLNGDKKNFLINFMPYMATSIIADYFNLGGPVASFSTACATGGYSIVSATKFIEENKCDVVIAGSTDASVVPLILAGFDKLGVLSKEKENLESAILPFDKMRKGFVIGEGAGILILEELEHAIKRYAKIYCIVSGYAATSDAYHITSFSPEAESISKAICLSLEKAGLTTRDIDYINAHGTGTILNDILETKAIKQSFKEYSKRLNISSTKSMTGHLLGASGSIEFIFISLSIKNDFIPPTINLKFPDPECDLNYTQGAGIQKKIKNALSLSFGFGGNIVSLIASKYD